MSFLKDITIEVEFTSKDKPIFRATTWVGYVGIFTGLNLEHKYSVAVNYRRTKPINYMTLIGNAISTFDMNWPVGYLVRETLSSNHKFEKAKDIFSNSPLISPTYISMCHKDNSCILTRDVDKLYKETTDWPLIQTNVDCDKTSPDILYSNQRREICQKLLESKNADIKKGLNVFPILNKETVYCNVIIPSTGYYMTSTESFT